MKKQFPFFRFILMINFTLVGSYSNSQINPSNGSASTATTSNTTTSTTTGASTTTSTNSSGTSTSTQPVSSSSALNQSANQARSQNKSSDVISKVMGVGMLGLGATYASCCGTANPGCCAKAVISFAMAAQSFKQSGANANAAYGAGLTGLDTSAWNNPFGDPGSMTAEEKKVSNMVNSGAFNKVKKDLTGKGLNGFKMDSNGNITDPSENTFKSSDLTNKSAMLAAGLPESSINSMFDQASKMEKEISKRLGLKNDVVGIGASTAENGYQEGGAGTVNSAGVSSLDTGYGSKSGGSAGSVRIPANSIAGLSKDFNGDKIGVAVDNIFNMMTRRYKTKEKQNTFYDPSELTKMPE